MTAPADLESPKGFGFGFGLGSGSGLGSGWSGSTCKVEIDGTRPAQSFEQDAATHSGRCGAMGVIMCFRGISQSPCVYTYNTNIYMVYYPLVGIYGKVCFLREARYILYCNF